MGFVIYMFIIESILLSAFLPKVSAYLPVTSAAAFAAGVDVQRVEGSAFSGDAALITVHSYLVAGLLMVGWTAIAVIGSAVVFRRRDVA